MAAQGSALDCSKHCHPKCRRAWRVYGLLAALLAAVLLAATLPSSLCLLAAEPEPGRGPGPGSVPGLEGLARLQEVQQQLQVRVAALEQALAATNRTLDTVADVPDRSLAEMREQWDGWRSQLDSVQGVVAELRQQLSQLQQRREEEAVIQQLQENNRALREEVVQQKAQLEEVWRDRSSFQEQTQRQIRRLSAEIWDLQRHHSGGSTAMLSGAAVALSLLVTLLAARWLH